LLDSVVAGLPLPLIIAGIAGPDKYYIIYLSDDFEIKRSSLHVMTLVDCEPLQSKFRKLFLPRYAEPLQLPCVRVNQILGTLVVSGWMELVHKSNRPPEI
jgi:hypothetical protein